MTVEEKAMQVSCAVPTAVLGREGSLRNQADTLLQHGIGHIAGIGLIGHKTPKIIAKSVNIVPHCVMCTFSMCGLALSGCST